MTEKKDLGFCIGIDLGTTYSCVGVMKDNSVHIIANEQGNRTTPSVVAFGDGERMIGEAAKNQAAMNPTNTLYGIKRLIGRQFTDPTVQKDMKLWPFKVVQDAQDRPLVEVTFSGEIKQFEPLQISAMVLGKMRQIAESFLGEPVQKAVITVPAYFNDTQRAATKDAGHVAGLEVLRIINEPTAAALAYGLQKGDEKSDYNILVFDLGGGTFDVSILTIDDGVYEVKMTGGDTHLGGEDFDDRMVTFLVAEFKKKYKKDISASPRSIRRLRTACERAKRTLSSSTEAMVEIDSLYEGIDFSHKFTRAQFESLNREFFEQCLMAVEKVIREAKMDKTKIQEVILVGGSTRIPKIKGLLSDFFRGKKLCEEINPDEAVAYGASVQGAILCPHSSNQPVNKLVIDVAPLSLGIETGGRDMTVIIPRGSPIPKKGRQIFTTYVDNQTSVKILVYEGERPRAKDNNLLGEFDLSEIAPAPRGVPQIEVTLDLDSNGILNVTAEDKANGRKKQITIKSNNKRSEADIKRMIEEAEKSKQQDAEYTAASEARHQLEAMISSIKSSSENKKNVEVDKLLAEATAWIQGDVNGSRRKEEYEAYQAQLTNKVSALGSSVTGGDPGEPGAPSGFEGAPFSTGTSSGPKKGPKIEEVD